MGGRWHRERGGEGESLRETERERERERESERETDRETFGVFTKPELQSTDPQDRDHAA
jgi:hypothetical protein